MRQPEIVEADRTQAGRQATQDESMSIGTPSVTTLSRRDYPAQMQNRAV
jgi:hypothetical protein